MGVINVTPDSFSDGGVLARSRDGRRSRRADGGGGRRHARRRRRVDASRRAAARCRGGAAARDAGHRGACRRASTCRSPSTPTRRRPPTPRSPRARRSSTTSAACGTSRSSREVVARRGAAIILMHTRGRSQRHVQAGRPTTTSSTKCSTSCARASRLPTGAGIAKERILVDPGLGFAKEAAHSYEVLGAARRVRRARPARSSSGRRAKSFLTRAARQRACRAPSATGRRRRR